jgi:hypothetical protein
MNRPVYHKFQLPNGAQCVMYEGDAGDMMDACVESGGNAAGAVYILITKLCTINGQPILMDDLRKLSMPALTQISDVLNNQMQSV